MRFKHVSEVIQMEPNEEPHRSHIARLKAEYGGEKYRESGTEKWMVPRRGLEPPRLLTTGT
jgi:hypothetical protein